MAKPKKAWLIDRLNAAYEELWQVLVLIRHFQTKFRLAAGVVILKVSITFPIMFSNVSRDLWCAIWCVQEVYIPHPKMIGILEGPSGLEGRTKSF